ncbi:MAG: HPF/RaiA family ribosome-associated protein [Muribaculaceae bacterium]|nr:HPF/RaiA family ribosome-associated protein [Muribaculaceae bacterium]MDE6321342.1 HPF/RaiA family ribosome-associated protein [Muribaculaceae bacterium]
MEVRIQAIHFDANQRLVDFINKKVDRVLRRVPDATDVEVTLKVVKPETAMNKEAMVKFTIPQTAELVADKVADTFEEAVDQCLEAIERQVEKKKAVK